MDRAGQGSPSASLPLWASRQFQTGFPVTPSAALSLQGAGEGRARGSEEVDGTWIAPRGHQLIRLWAGWSWA